MTKQDWNPVAETAKDTGSGLVDSLGAMIDYPKHHDISQRVIDGTVTLVSVGDLGGFVG